MSEYGIVGVRGQVNDSNIFYNHMPASQVRHHVGEDVWSEYLKITAIRNPYDKAVSGFFFDQQRSGITYSAMELGRMREDFKSYLKEGRAPKDRQIYTIDGEIVADLLLRYESLSAQLLQLGRRLDIDIDPAKLPNYKVGIRPRGIQIDALYDAEAARLVEARYAFEFEAFGYKKFHQGAFDVPGGEWIA